MLSPDRKAKILERLKAHFSGETVDWQSSSPHVLFLGILHEVASEVEAAFAADQVAETVLGDNPALLSLRAMLDRGASCAPSPGSAVVTLSALIPVGADGDVEFSPRVESGTTLSSQNGVFCTLVEDLEFESGSRVSYAEGETEVARGEVAVLPAASVGTQKYEKRFKSARALLAKGALEVQTVALADSSTSPLVLPVSGSFSSCRVTDLSSGELYTRVSSAHQALSPLVYLEFYDLASDTLFLIFLGGALCKRPASGAQVEIRSLKSSTFSAAAPEKVKLQTLYTTAVGVASAQQSAAMQASISSVAAEAVRQSSGARAFESRDLLPQMLNPGATLGGPLQARAALDQLQKTLPFELDDLFLDRRSGVLYLWKRGAQGRVHELSEEDLVAVERSARRERDLLLSAEVRSGKVADVVVVVRRVPGLSVKTQALREKLQAARAQSPRVLKLVADDPAVASLGAQIQKTTGVRWTTPQTLLFPETCRYTVSSVRVE